VGVNKGELPKSPSPSPSHRGRGTDGRACEVRIITIIVSEVPSFYALPRGVLGTLEKEGALRPFVAQRQRRRRLPVRYEGSRIVVTASWPFLASAPSGSITTATKGGSECVSFASNTGRERSGTSK
jgi:hypothetical protein